MVFGIQDDILKVNVLFKNVCVGGGGDLLDSGHQAAGLDLLDSDHQAAGLDLLRSDHQAAGLDLLCSDHSTCILLFILD